MNSSSSFWVTAVLVKVRVGNCSTSRKSADFTWASRSALLVLKLEATMVSEADDFAGSAPSSVRLPVNSEKPPRTLATMAWRATKPIVECVGSISQVPVVAARSVLMVILQVMGPRGGM